MAARVQEAFSNALVDAHRVGRTVAMALEPDLEQLTIGLRIGVQGGEAVNVGTEHVGDGRSDDFQLGSGHAFFFR